MEKNILNHQIRQKPISPPLFIDAQKTVVEKKHRCQNCNKLLGVEQLIIPSFNIKCVRCGEVNTLLKDYERQIIITDKNGSILYMNEHAEKATGYSLQEVVGKTPAVWGNQMPKNFYKAMWDDISKKKAVVVQLTNKHKNGTFYSVILRISPLLDVHGNIEFFMGMETLINDK